MSGAYIHPDGATLGGTLKRDSDAPWVLRLYPNERGVYFLEWRPGSGRPPIWFHRLMVRLLLGWRWERTS